MALEDTYLFTQYYYENCFTIKKSKANTFLKMSMQEVKKVLAKSARLPSRMAPPCV